MSTKSIAIYLHSCFAFPLYAIHVHKKKTSTSLIKPAAALLVKANHNFNLKPVTKRLVLPATLARIV